MSNLCYTYHGDLGVLTPLELGRPVICNRNHLGFILDGGPGFLFYYCCECNDIGFGGVPVNMAPPTIQAAFDLGGPAAAFSLWLDSQCAQELEQYATG